MTMKTNVVLGVGGCCIILAMSAFIQPEPVRALPTGNLFQPRLLTEERGFVSGSPGTTQPSVSVQFNSTPHVGPTGSCGDEPFKPVLLRDMQRPLPDNEVWIAQALLLNASEGNLARPGRWAAPATLLHGDHWK
jgi:hypothetical protein